ncbi:intraflagellar transport protein 20 homolog [Malaya genurostris]|uniref:intraflagellar transport protein 20 homolog n=1 Tax=Malaya genurostris TaxID=325434 RepID=UPI0026F3B764|nr:intraflagellar transport protein 20 homolog [Malaya genurostris]XP_058460790.1 intraflagellar transport protein 20 homolog [Malaya genurostris]
MSEEFGESGLYIDDLYTLRVIDPEVSHETNVLKEESEKFTDKLDEFRQITEDLVSIVESFSAEVDQEKMRAIGVQNLLKTFSKKRESEQQQIQSEIVEKMIELDKLKIEYQYLQRIESEQQEIIDNFYQNQ